MDAFASFIEVPKFELGPLDLDDNMTLIFLGVLLGFFAAYLLGPICCIVSITCHFLSQCAQGTYVRVGSFGSLLRNWTEVVVEGVTGWKTNTTFRAWKAEQIRSGEENRSYDKTQPNWYGTERDIDFFKSRITEEAGRWKSISENNLSDILSYESFYRVLPGNKTEYKSVTYVKNTTAEEMTDFYLDDACRQTWDNLLSHAEQLERGPVDDKCEVVRWIRSFHLPFLTDREYVIGRRIFRKEDKIYTITKGIEHAAAPIQRSLIRMDVFYSMWSCRDVPCPWGSDKTACEVVLLHHEQFKIPEKLARFAACKGMWGFVRMMGPAIVNFVQTRREQEMRRAVGSRRLSTEESLERNYRSEKPNKLMKTARRALLATIVTAALVIRRNQHCNAKQG